MNGPLHSFLLKHRDDAGLSLAEIKALCEKHEQLTKREEFAKAAMQGLLAHPACGNINPNLAAMAAREATQVADALIAELNKPTTL